MKTIGISDIEKMHYVQFISFLRETNRCPGGKKTIAEIIKETFISSSSKVLEVGSNTGFTSLEIARIIKCKCIGIDPVAEAVEEANRLLASDTPQIQNLVQFKVASAYDLPFPNNTFDLVIAGGATSFMDNKLKAIQEYHRVLQNWGFLSITNLCYLKEPPKHVVHDISRIIGVTINPWGPEQYLEIFLQQNYFELFSKEEVFLGCQEANKINDYVEYFIQKPHIKDLNEDCKNAIRKKWHSILDIFNENHKYLGFIRVVFRKRYLEEEPELFIVKKR